MSASKGSGAISPTAHYTGETWVRNGLSHPELATAQGRFLHRTLALPNAASRRVGGPTLEGLLLARHRIIDSLLDDWIERGVSQVLEVACGMSPRGWRFGERYGDRLTYVEADLPAMARRKREALARMGSLGEHHRVVELDILRDGGPGSLDSLAEELDPARGLVVITEGLLTYFDDPTVEALWARLARVLSRFSPGAYLADLRFARPDRGLPERAFDIVLGAFVRGRVHAYRGDETTAETLLRSAGFEQARLHRGDAHPAAAEARERSRCLGHLHRRGRRLGNKPHKPTTSDRYKCSMRLLPVVAVFVLGVVASAWAKGERIARCQDQGATLVGSPGADRLRGTKGPDVIVAGGGNDTIHGRGGNDRICGGAGADRIFGGRGVDRLWGGGDRDRIRGGRASDRIAGGSGRDRLIGDRGNDRMRGGPGSDFLDSALGDDTLAGGEGHDVLIGGLGIDHLFGQAGNDLLRGDFGPDELAGGRGRDVASFALATPPGPAGLDGVLVDLRNGWARGDGRPDILRGIEDVAGSAFDDVIRGDAGDNRIDGGPGPDELRGGGGRDEMDHGSEQVSRTATTELLGGRAPVLVVTGGPRADRIEIGRRGDGFAVRGTRGSSGCLGDTEALCRTGGVALTGLLVFGGQGPDLIRVSSGLPASLGVKIDGYRGNDRLVGGAGIDVLDGGPGHDHLSGKGGGDAVIARSDGDRVHGGAGSDLLVVADPCEGHRLVGGPGIDSASFSRLHYGNRHRGIRARIGGTAITRNARCAQADRISRSVESLEGSWGHDILIGDGRDNTLLGRFGNDLLLGRGGADRLVGGGGRDALRGGRGQDRDFQ